MIKYIIGSYYELDQGHETPHSEEVINAEDIEQARKISAERYGWGSWACQYDPLKHSTKPANTNEQNRQNL